MGVEFKDFSMKVKGEINENIKRFLYEAAEEIVSEAKRNSEVDNGETKNSYQYKVDIDNRVAVVGSNAVNAIYEEFGTGEYALNHDGRKSAWYIPVNEYHGRKKPTYQGKVVVVYGKEGKQFFKTDGKKPRRPLFKAFSSKSGSLKRRMSEIMKEVNDK